MAQWNILSTPSNFLSVGYNNESKFSSNLIVGSNNKITTPFTSVLGNNNFVTGGNNLLTTHIVGHNNIAHSSKGIIHGSNNTVVSNHHHYIFGDNNTIATGLTSVHIIGSGINATNSNTMHIGHHLSVSGLINGIDISTVQTVQNFTPTASTDTSGSIGDLTYDTSYLYIKTNNGWLRTSLSAF